MERIGSFHSPAKTADIVRPVAEDLHPHGHFLVLDGVYAGMDGERPVFYPVRAPDAKDVAEVSQRVGDFRPHQDQEERFEAVAPVPL